MEVLIAVVVGIGLALLFLLTAPWIIFAFLRGFFEIYEDYLEWVADKMRV